MEYQVDETETVHFTISYLYFPNRLLFQLVESKDCLAFRQNWNFWLRSGGKSDSGHHHPFSWRTALQPCDWPLQVIGFPTVLDRITQGWSNRALWPLCRCAGLWRETHGCWPMFTGLGWLISLAQSVFFRTLDFYWEDQLEHSLLSSSRILGHFCHQMPGSRENKVQSQDDSAVPSDYQLL